MLGTQDTVTRGVFRLQTGDLVVNRTGYPVLQEVINVREDGLLRVRGLEWPAGYTALVAVGDVQPMSGKLQDWLGT